MLVKNLVSTCLLVAAGAAAAPIGMITASGHFTVGGASVWGNSTLFDGATIETSDASSELRLNNGVRVQLGAESRARVWADHLVLEKGVGQVGAPESFSINAGGLEIHAAGAGSRLRVGLGAELEVAALVGSARVQNPGGLLLASIAPGRSAKIALQGAQNGVVNHTGCLLSKDGRFIQQDEDSQQVFEINGPADLKANVGNRVQTTGRLSTTRPVIPIATAVINVATVSPRSQGGCLSVASALEAQANPADAPSGAAPPAGQPVPQAGAAKGLSTGAKIGIAAAVAGGGAGAAIALASGGSKKSTSP